MASTTARLNIVVGITGGIAAYKAVAVVRQLVLAGHDVHVVPTEAALRFVGRPTLEELRQDLRALMQACRQDYHYQGPSLASVERA